eukprot:gb/GEZJ01002278.1/.p1 GENE.gb/GEZJ01002278.1/~~gb/GEZJ01002278.1/.p1  ORF type:complete len:592 (+),score=68.54 gb/GEZJ01002278.1/:824-2599(+)
MVAVPHMAQFVLFRAPGDYQSLKKAIRDYESGRKAFVSPPDLSFSPQVTTRKILRHTNAPFGTAQQLERKLDQLAGQFEELTILVKKTFEGPSGSSDKYWTCSYCDKPGHGANRCPSNPHRNTRCRRCGMFGHQEETCWSKPKQEEKRAVGFSGVRSESAEELKMKKNEEEDHVAVVQESPGVRDVVSAAKRNADGEALKKQPRTGIMEIDALVNKSPGTFRKVAAPKGRKKTRKPKKSKGSAQGLHDQVGKYNVMAELAAASPGLTFGQLLRGDADETRKLLKPLLSGMVLIRHASFLHATSLPRRLKGIATDASALLDSGAVPNLLSWEMCNQLTLAPSPTSRRVIVADGSAADVLGCVKGVSISFRKIGVPLDLLVVKNTPFDVIIGCPTLEALQAQLVFSRQQVSLTIGAEEVLLQLYNEPPVVDGARTDSEYFVFLDDSGPDVFPAESVSSSSGSAGESESESELVLALVDREHHEPDLAGVDSDVPSSGEDEESARSALLSSKMAHLRPDLQKKMTDFLKETDIIAWSSGDLCPADVPVKHSFELTDEKPLHSKVRRMPPRHNAVIRKEVNELLKTGIITPSSSA